MSNALTVEPLVGIKIAGSVQTPHGEDNYMLYKVICRDHGDVTRAESGGALNDARLVQAVTYARRHLSRHLSAIADQMADLNS